MTPDPPQPGPRTRGYHFTQDGVPHCPGWTWNPFVEAFERLGPYDVPGPSAPPETPPRRPAAAPEPELFA